MPVPDGTDRRPRILVVGGYGVFGARVVERLARTDQLAIIVAGRDLAHARLEVARLQPRSLAPIEAARIDAERVGAAELAALRPTVVVNASGPFQRQDTTLAGAAIGAGAHYVDLADAREFVTGITALDADARAANVLVVSGASSVPALSAALIEASIGDFTRLTDVHYGISPGNRFDPGLATTRSILGSLGRPFPVLEAGKTRPAHGWQRTIAHRFGDHGIRLMGACDIPDLALFPARYPTLATLRFSAGVEVKAFHLALTALSWLARAGVVREPERLAAPLLGLKRRLGWLGSDTGCMFMTLAGVGRDGQPARRTWHVIGASGHGPYIPAIPATILARRLAAGKIGERGARACLGLMSLAEFKDEVADLDIRVTLT